MGSGLFNTTRKYKPRQSDREERFRTKEDGYEVHPMADARRRLEALKDKLELDRLLEDELTEEQPEGEES
jgi:hypothetical protein